MNDLINRKDLEKIIYDWLSLSKNYHFSTASISLQDLFNIIEHMSSVSQWIPCSEQLPEDGDEVIVTVWGNSTMIAWRYNNEWKTESFSLDDEEVSAWMPLPEPWKGEEE